MISGAGNGYVLRALPQNMISNSRITLDAADRLNADILSLLYPKTEVKRDDEILPESYFDAAITYAPAFPVGEKKAVSKRSSMILPNYAASNDAYCECGPSWWPDSADDGQRHGR